MVLQPLPHACCHAHPYCKMAVVRPCSLWGQCWLSPAAPWAVPELCHAMPCHAVPCRAVPCHAVPWGLQLRAAANPPAEKVKIAAGCGRQRSPPTCQHREEWELRCHCRDSTATGTGTAGMGSRGDVGRCGGWDAMGEWGASGPGCGRGAVLRGWGCIGPEHGGDTASWGQGIVGTGNRGRRSVWGWSIAGAVHVGGAREDAGTRSER